MRYTIGIAEEDDTGRIHEANNLLGIIDILCTHINNTMGDTVYLPKELKMYKAKSQTVDAYCENVPNQIEFLERINN